MCEIKNLADFIDNLLLKNCPFALWTLPGSKSPEILISDKEKIVCSTQSNNLNTVEGFVFAPYENGKETPAMLLKPGIYKKGIREILKINLDALPEQPLEDIDYYSPLFISRDQYIEDVESAIHEIKRTKLAKVIISRLISFPKKNESIGNVYSQLLKQTPNAFVYLVNIPFNIRSFSGAGLWMGATPEVLLRNEGKAVEIMSLAGTQLRRTENDYSWHTKEIEEQAFVSRYLLDAFYNFKIFPYTTHGPETLESGKVAHLVTTFRFTAKKLESELGELVAALHPTPAVCGYPKPRAATLISKIEKHSRRYYTGYLGPWRLNGKLELFVNLRCMEILPEQYILYSGAGITSRSVPEKEWEETNRKAATLLSAIETVQNR